MKLDYSPIHISCMSGVKAMITKTALKFVH